MKLTLGVLILTLVGHSSCKKKTVSQVKFAQNGAPAIQYEQGRDAMLAKMRSQNLNPEDLPLITEILAQFELAASHVTTVRLGQGQVTQPILLTNVTISRVKETSGNYGGEASFSVGKTQEGQRPLQGVDGSSSTQSVNKTGKTGASATLSYRTDTVSYNVTFYFRDTFKGTPPNQSNTTPSTGFPQSQGMGPNAPGMGVGGYPNSSMAPGLGGYPNTGPSVPSFGGYPTQGVGSSYPGMMNPYPNDFSSMNSFAGGFNQTVGSEGADFVYALPGGLHVQKNVNLKWSAQAEFDLSSVLTMQPPLVGNLLLLAMQSSTININGKFSWETNLNYNLPPEMIFKIDDKYPFTEFTQKQLNPMFMALCQRAAAIREAWQAPKLSCSNPMATAPSSLDVAKKAIENNIIMPIANCQKQGNDYYLYFPAMPEMFPYTPQTQMPVYAIRYTAATSLTKRATWQKTQGLSYKDAKLMEVSRNDANSRRPCQAFFRKKTEVCMMAISSNFGDQACRESSQNSTLRPYSFSISKQDIIVE